MNSIHDLGGMVGMGALPAHPPLEPYFKEDWERTAFGINILLIMSGIYIGDECRHSMERIPALRWLGTSYFEHWIDGIEILLKEKGVLTPEEIDALKPSPENARVAPGTLVQPADIEGIITSTGSAKREVGGKPLFKVGDQVRAKNFNPMHHTRSPRYARGHVGTVIASLGGYVFADTRAHEKGDAPQRYYRIKFSNAELWGPEDNENDFVIIDMYESYLEAVQ